MNIVVTAGHNRSLGTIALLNELLENQHQISEVIIVRTIQAKRLSAYFRQFGFKTILAKFIAHYLQKEGTYLNAETNPIKDLVRSRGITEKSVSDFCTARSIPFSSTASLASIKTVQHCRELMPELIIYSGGGILSKDFIKTASRGVLNAHSGPLPDIRGMNAIEWSLVEQWQPTTTVHLIDSGIDTGKILYAEPIPIRSGDSIYDLRGKAIPHNVALLTKVANSYDLYNSQSIEQNPAEGRQYYVMHEMMKSCIQGY